MEGSAVYRQIYPNSNAVGTHTSGEGSWTGSTGGLLQRGRWTFQPVACTYINAQVVICCASLWYCVKLFCSDSLWLLASSTKWKKASYSTPNWDLDLLMVLSRPVSGRIECDFYNFSHLNIIISSISSFLQQVGFWSSGLLLAVCLAMKSFLQC